MKKNNNGCNVKRSSSVAKKERSGNVVNDHQIQHKNNVNPTSAIKIERRKK